MSDIEQRLREGIGRSGISGGICADDCDAANRLMDEAADTIASLRSKLEEAEGALERLLNAKALSNVRSLVAGWNGEDRPDGPFKERHPSRLGARIETNCGRVYELDEAMQDARRTLSSLREADHA